MDEFCVRWTIHDGLGLSRSVYWLLMSIWIICSAYGWSEVQCCHFGGTLSITTQMLFCDPTVTWPDIKYVILLFLNRILQKTRFKVYQNKAVHMCCFVSIWWYHAYKSSGAVKAKHRWVWFVFGSTINITHEHDVSGTRDVAINYKSIYFKIMYI